MFHRFTQFFARVAVGGVVLVATASCLRDKSHDRAAAGTVDTASPAASAITPATGPGVQVTRTDGESVRLATQFKLTDENFAKFLKAADSLSALAARDSSARNHLSRPIADAGSTELDAGLKWLESNAAANNAIVANGLSARDYFVMAIAIASAEQTKPSTAPPTPVARRNAEFLRRRSAEVERLHRLESGRPAVVVTP